jgi:biopolymer transport protein ExbD
VSRRRSKFRAQASDGSVGHINVTPLIDVVMCLIIFFLLVGRLASQQGKPISLPSSGVGDTETPPRLVLAVAPSTTIGTPELTLGGTSVSLAELPAMLKARLGETAATAPLAIRADRRLSWGEVRPVVEACRAAGLSSVKLVTERAATRESEKP